MNADNVKAVVCSLPVSRLASFFGGFILKIKLRLLAGNHFSFDKQTMSATQQRRCHGDASRCCPQPAEKTTIIITETIITDQYSVIDISSVSQ